VTNVNAFRQGQTMPIQQPGLGLINLAVHPLDSAKGVVGWQYHNDPMRFTAFAGTNLFAMIATGGLGELGEAGMAARLSRLAEIGTGTSGARIAAEINRLAARLDELPASRQRNPARRKWVRSQRRDATRDLADANDRLKALQASHAERVARLQAAADRLKALRDNRGVRAVADAQTLYLASLIRKIPGGRRVWTLARVALEEYLELSSMGDAGQKHDAPVRQRLRDLAAAHPGSVHA